MSASRQKAPSMPSSIGMVSLNASVNGAPAQRGTPLSKALTPNDLWCADFKGEFKLGNGRYCYPLTVTDQASRFLLMCEALDTTREKIAMTAFQRLFLDHGLPRAISLRQWCSLRQS